jgi:hypothetical protein
MGCLLVYAKLSKMRSIAALLAAQPPFCKTAFDLAWIPLGLWISPRFLPPPGFKYFVSNVLEDFLPCWAWR